MTPATEKARMTGKSVMLGKQHSDFRKTVEIQTLNQQYLLL
ncbi:hypothetical protein [Methylomonas albis]|jgi:hypothetical protein|nr:hypothetical protein [Methylomonas albis]